jgi:hypothetical protein
MDLHQYMSKKNIHSSGLPNDYTISAIDILGYFFIQYQTLLPIRTTLIE